MADGGWSDAQEAAILEYYFAGQAAVNKTSTWCALCLAAPADNSNTISEPTYANYGRIEILQAGWTLPATQGDPTYLGNANVVQFAECQEASAEKVTHWALMSAETGGLLLFSGLVVVPAGGLDLGNGIQPQFDAGALQVRLGS